MLDLIKEIAGDKKIVLLGFGREGQSTYRILRKSLPGQALVINDRDGSVRNNPLLSGDRNISFNTGENYLDNLGEFDLIIKSPGISLHGIRKVIAPGKITSQTDLFLRRFAGQVIGITGTKGKSTTASLLHHILKMDGKDAILLGNIGRPAFNYYDDITPRTILVFELSSHQLEYVTCSPHISVLLNLYQEHLDAYPSYLDYQLAKMNITRFQGEKDDFIYNLDDEVLDALVKRSGTLARLVPFSFDRKPETGSFIENGKIIFTLEGAPAEAYDLGMKRKLKGDHNIRNIMAVINVCKLLGVSDDAMIDGISSFRGLDHRLEHIGIFHGIDFYDDSISTIPEASIAAVKAIGNVDTLILGGFDRGVDYSGLAAFLVTSTVRNIVFTGAAGKRMHEEINALHPAEKNLLEISRFDDFLDPVIRCTRPGDVCLLSPAAASYDEFPNFEVRGNRFRELVTGEKTK
jgi:UDP-N-acetylmuramoyl-L-alanine---L-glutamate ligase